MKAPDRYVGDRVDMPDGKTGVVLSRMWDGTEWIYEVLLDSDDIVYTANGGLARKLIYIN